MSIDESIEAALSILDREGVYRIPVVDGHHVVGGIGRHEIQNVQERRRLGLQPHQRSQVRWRSAEPTKGLTWGVEVSGQAFIEKAKSYGAFARHQAILEIGPGYGRLLRECLRQQLPFRKYVAVDISPANVAYLTEQFGESHIEVINGDIETVSLDYSFDVVLSSLTLKHLYPSFEAAFRNAERHLNPGATLIFDLIEGESAWFTEKDDVTFIRHYSREGLKVMLQKIPLEVVAFDQVEHAPGQVRLLVVARKPG